jgi:quinol monooxygenase YgiN
MDGTGDRSGIPRPLGWALPTIPTRSRGPTDRRPPSGRAPTHSVGYGGMHHDLEVSAAADGGEVELTVVVMRFQARDPEALLGVLAKYVVLARGHPGCRNVDLVASVTTPGRLVVIQKWDSPEAQRAHFDAADMVEMAQACRGLLTEPPDIDLLEAISAHDLA